MIGRVKPSPFTYHAPGSLDEALSVLSEFGEHGKVLAGGQSLVPILNMRLAAPEHLVDINRIRELNYVRAEAEGVRVGALARHADVESDDAAYTVQPLLREALRLVAHPVIRNRGTTVGSLAHADPAAEMTAVLTLLGGSVGRDPCAGRGPSAPMISSRVRSNPRSVRTSWRSPRGSRGSPGARGRLSRRWRDATVTTRSAVSPRR
jgi:carbon-monoxide dehydrogenase medium subunit